MLYIICIYTAELIIQTFLFKFSEILFPPRRRRRSSSNFTPPRWGFWKTETTPWGQSRPMVPISYACVCICMCIHMNMHVHMHMHMMCIWYAYATAYSIAGTDALNPPHGWIWKECTKLTPWVSFPKKRIHPLGESPPLVLFSYTLFFPKQSLL